VADQAYSRLVRAVSPDVFVLPQSAPAAAGARPRCGFLLRNGGNREAEGQGDRALIFLNLAPLWGEGGGREKGQKMITACLAARCPAVCGCRGRCRNVFIITFSPHLDPALRSVAEPICGSKRYLAGFASRTSFRIDRGVVLVTSRPAPPPGDVAGFDQFDQRVFRRSLAARGVTIKASLAIIFRRRADNR